MHKGPGHHLLVPSQYMGGGPWVKVFRWCGLVVGRKWGLFWGSRSSFFGEISYWDGISPKSNKYGLGHLMHAIEVGDEVAYPYPYG